MARDVQKLQREHSRNEKILDEIRKENEIRQTEKQEFIQKSRLFSYEYEKVRDQNNEWMSSQKVRFEIEKRYLRKKSEKLKKKQINTIKAQLVLERRKLNDKRKLLLDDHSSKIKQWVSKFDESEVITVNLRGTMFNFTLEQFISKKTSIFTKMINGGFGKIG